MPLTKWELIFETKIIEVATADDPAHDILHFRRVVKMAKELGRTEGGKLEVIVPAAWLHDLVIVPKNSPLRSQASKLSAERAIEFLAAAGYPAVFYDEIFHAIEGHSFSANIDVKSIEAKVVQDADRLDGLGAVGIARCFATSGLLKRSLYHAEDPFCDHREPDDLKYTIDHFYKKLFKTAETLKTRAGRDEGIRRVESMRRYLEALRAEI